MQNRANPPAAGSPTDTVSATESFAASSVSTATSDVVGDGRLPVEVAELVSQRDEAYQRMLEAVDALRGAQAEQAAARARVAELEHQVHVYVAENEHLRSLVRDGDGDGVRRKLGSLARTVGAATMAKAPGRASDSQT